MDVEEVFVENPEHRSVIVGQTHFIKTAEDLHEALVNSVPGILFGLAFCEASGPCLVRAEGTDEALKGLAAQNAPAPAGGGPGWGPLPPPRGTPLTVLVAETTRGRGIVGVIDGERAKAIETEQDVSDRRAFVRRIGYKLM